MELLYVENATYRLKKMEVLWHTRQHNNNNTANGKNISVLASDLVEENGVERHALFWAELLQFAPKVILDGFVGHIAAVSTNSALTPMLLGIVMLVEQFAACLRETNEYNHKQDSKDIIWNRKL